MTGPFKEFTKDELTALGSKGIWPDPGYILARFLESLRNNLNPESLRKIIEVNQTFFQE